MPSSVNRFSNRVDHYAKYRPSYPPELLELFRQQMGLKLHSVIADMGSGTGISARVFLEHGNLVYGVEPNEAMRAAAEASLASFTGFRSVPGTAEKTGLPEASVDFIIAAQAFHWFEPEATRAEFVRILRPGGFVVLIWNERQLDSTPFLREYEQFLLKFGNDYRQVRHENVTAESLQGFFQRDFQRASFLNLQILPFEGLLGRVLSSSYMPSEADKNFPEMQTELRSLFDRHATDGKIELRYNTTVYYSTME